MIETLQGDLGCNRRVGGLCSCVPYQLVHLEVRYDDSGLWCVPMKTTCTHMKPLQSSWG